NEDIQFQHCGIDDNEELKKS
ncbi:glucose-6-phosphate 1-dehydrogenase, partial [Trichonephila inaurata madagascariensis]